VRKMQISLLERAEGGEVTPSLLARLLAEDFNKRIPGLTWQKP